MEENETRANRPNNNNKKMEMDWTHVEERQIQRKTHTSLEPQGHRKRGRPKNTWRRYLNSDLQKIGKNWGEAKKIAKDRKNGKQQWSPYVPLYRVEAD